MNGGAEGVTVAKNGDVFFATAKKGLVFKAPKGDFSSASVVADLLPDDSFGDVGGMDVDRHDNAYVNVGNQFDASLHGIWKVQPDGTSELAAPLPIGFASLPNDIAIDNRGNVYGSDSFAGRIWRLAPDGVVTEWVVDDLLRAFFTFPDGTVLEFGVNGLTYHRGALASLPRSLPNAAHSASSSRGSDTRTNASKEWSSIASDNMPSLPTSPYERRKPTIRMTALA